ncbi:hypothetical protein C1645_875149 [Glomus cerebriforme]|uniref:P-loop containing nucleoside triphosphate hydrolase protein n=1 Tax=Glomus cerebriforme TaxID=658196 RepID=A0A397T4Q3_9GLOM|nr:hypothetical protein C1645_875149 [Glomus cerebriforme]
MNFNLSKAPPKFMLFAFRVASKVLCKPLLCNHHFCRNHVLRFVEISYRDQISHKILQMSFSKITQVFRRTVFPTHFVTRRVQCLQSPRPDLFHLPFSRTFKHWKEYKQENELMGNQLGETRKQLEAKEKLLAVLVEVQQPERKRKATEEEKQNKRKWDTNGAIRKVQRDATYFVDPLSSSGPLLNKIRNGEFVALHGARASGKSTRVFRVMEQLEEEGYLCLYVTLELVDIESKESFWSSFGKCLVRTAPHHIKKHIKFGGDFADLFSTSGWKKKVVLFIDEFDILYEANDDIKSSFLKVVRGIKTRKEEFAIWSINAVGPFSILHLSSKKVTSSPFNIKEPFQNPNFTLEQVQILFKEFADEERIIIDQEIVKDIYIRTNGHAGLVCLCGKVISLHLMKKIDKSLTLDISTWLDFTTSGSLEKVILGYPTFRKMVDTLETLDKAKPAVDLLRSSFIGFLGSVQIINTREMKLAEFLTAEGVLTVSNNINNTFRMSSGFIDELMRRRVIPDLYESSPTSAVPIKDDDTLDILNILQTAIQFFDKTIISNGFTKSFKIARDLYVNGRKNRHVPRESVYDAELSRILANWLVKKCGFDVIGQWHLDEHTHSDIVITTDRQKIVLELLATATKKDLDEHFERVLKYAELLSADDIWIVHFTCEDGYATQKLQWPSNDRINVIHFFHDQMLVNVLMNVRYLDSSGTIKYITDQTIPLQS